MVGTIYSGCVGDKIMEITLTSQNFKNEVLESKEPVLVDFWASWCGPCQMMGPVVSEIAKDKAGQIKVGKVNVDDESDLAQQYGIMSIPSFILFKDGKIEKSFVGATTKEGLLQNLGL